MNKALKWLLAGLVFLIIGRALSSGAWQGDALWCRQLAAIGAQAGCRLLLVTICPGADWREEQASVRTAVSPDPSYAVYQKYRYTYQTYVYLFSGGEKEEKSSGKASYGSAEWWKTMGWQNGNDAYDSGLSEAEGQETGSGGAFEGISVKKLISAEQISRLQDYDYLMKTFYSVHPSTTAGRSLMKADDLLDTDLSLDQDGSVPQILIYHTHSQETYADYGPGNLEASVVGAGNYLTALLQAKGWNVIHDTSAYDIQGGKLDRNRAYTYALEGITKILQEHPTVQVIIDLHRDGVRDGVRLVSEVNGKPTANIMFFQGISRTPEGPIEYLPNPYIRENSAFAFQMQLGASVKYPGLTRKIYLKGLRYNLHLRPRSTLIELGAQTNTGQEALNAMEPLAELLDMVLQGK